VGSLYPLCLWDARRLLDADVFRISRSRWPRGLRVPPGFPRPQVSEAPGLPHSRVPRVSGALGLPRSQVSRAPGSPALPGVPRSRVSRAPGCPVLPGVPCSRVSRAPGCPALPGLPPLPLPRPDVSPAARSPTPSRLPSLRLPHPASSGLPGSQVSRDRVHIPDPRCLAHPAPPAPRASPAPRIACTPHVACNPYVAWAALCRPSLLQRRGVSGAIDVIVGRLGVFLEGWSSAWVVWGAIRPERHTITLNGRYVSIRVARGTRVAGPVVAAMPSALVALATPLYWPPLGG
jgi:hypothetical protein